MVRAMWSDGGRAVSTWRALCLALCACASISSAALAESPRKRLLVLRNDPTESALTKELDAALLRALSEHARFESTYISPTPYAELELAAGCREHTDACTSRIATSLHADWLLVRELTRDADGALVLRLVAQDGATAKARALQALLPLTDATRRELVMSELVAGLYGHASDVRTAKSTAPAPVDERRPLRIAVFSVLLASGAFLAGAIVEGARGKNEHARYRTLDVDDAQSAALADEYLASAQKHTRVANGLIASGAVLATTGVSFFIWDRVQKKQDQRARVALGIYAAPRMGLVTVAAPWTRTP